MTDLQRWLDQEWKEARPIFWVAENIKDYHAIDGNTKVLEEITQYSQIESAVIIQLSSNARI